MLFRGYASLHSHQRCTKVLFSTSLPTLAISCLSDNSPSGRFEVISHCGLDLYFPDDLAYFHVSVGHLYVFLGKMSIQVFSSTSNQIAFAELYEFFIYFGYYPISNI